MMPPIQCPSSNKNFLILVLILTSLLIVFVVLYFNSSGSSERNSTDTIQALDFKDFADWDRYDNETGFPSPIVPNIVHFFKLQRHELTFVEHIVLLAIWCNQRPERIMIHCDCDDLSGPYWEKVKDLSGVEVQRIIPHSEIALVKDVARIAVLKQYGGIALDFDMYVVRSLDEFRRFECTVGWPERANTECQIVIAHKKARFLQVYMESYRADNGYSNVSELPARILQLMPHIVHRVPLKLGGHDLERRLYTSKLHEWHSYYAIHLLMSHDEKTSHKLDEYNIRIYAYTFGEMARQLIFGTTDFIPLNKNVSWEYTQCRK